MLMISGFVLVVVIFLSKSLESHISNSVPFVIISKVLQIGSWLFCS